MSDDPLVDDPAGPGRPRRLPPAITAMAAIVAVAVLVVTRIVADPEADRASRASPTRANAAPTVIEDPALTVPPERRKALAFDDVTESAGLATTQRDERSVHSDFSAGAAVGDVFGTGRDDIYITRIGKPNSLYRNNGDGTFTDVAAELGLLGPDPAQGSSAAAFADVDGDGCMDLYVSGARAARDALFMNGCGGQPFRDETTDRGIVGGSGPAPFGNQVHGVSFADYDNDGDLDLLVVQWDATFDLGAQRPGCEGVEVMPDPTAQTRSRLWNNDGSGHFTDVTRQVGLDLEDVAAFTPQFVDLDGDSWLDLLLAADFCGSRVYRNDRGVGFSDVTSASGIGANPPENGMGSAVADLDNDGRPDWFITSVGFPTANDSCPLPEVIRAGCSGNRVYVNRGGFRFEDRTDQFGLRNGWWGWGAAIDDFDNDGVAEVVQTNGYVNGESEPDARVDPLGSEVYRRFIADPMRFWILDDGRYVDVAADLGLDDRGVGHCLVPLDFDADGRQDLLVCNSSAVPRLFRNVGETGHWIGVQLHDPSTPGNREGIGARITVIDGEGTRTVRWVTTDGSYESQKPARAHVGLGSVAKVRTVEVVWPGSATAQVISRPPTDAVLTITRQTSR